MQYLSLPFHLGNILQLLPLMDPSTLSRMFDHIFSFFYRKIQISKILLRNRILVARTLSFRPCCQDIIVEIVSLRRCVLDFVRLSNNYTTTITLQQSHKNNCTKTIVQKQLHCNNCTKTIALLQLHCNNYNAKISQ